MTITCADGVHTASVKLKFHWKCMMAPLTVIDYIVVHELAHLIHSNHSAAFWNEVDKVMPDFQERKCWLRIMGRGWICEDEQRDEQRGHPMIVSRRIRGLSVSDGKVRRDVSCLLEVVAGTQQSEERI